MISTLDLLAHPHISIPYVQIGLITALETSNLFSKDRLEFLPISQLISFSFKSVYSRFLAMCSFQFSLRSKCSPRYFTDSTCGRTVWLILNAGQLSFLRVKVMCDDWVSFTFIFHFLASSLRCWGVPGGCLRLSWDQHGSQISLCRPRMCPSLCPWL